MNANPRRGRLQLGPHWSKSSRSYTNGDCLEVRLFDEGIEVRDSKHPDGPTLTYQHEEWLAFIAGVADLRRR